MKMMIQRATQLIALILAMTLFVPTAMANQTTEIYETYLAANKLVPVLQPLVGPNDKITAYRNKLFVKAPPHVQNEILAILEEIDRPLQNIQISLRYGQIDQTQQKQNESTVKVFRGSSKQNGVEVEMVNKNRFSTKDSTADQSIQVLEGEQAALNVGKEYPTVDFVYLNPLQSGAAKTYRNVGNQMYVTPRRMQDKIRLEISSENSRLKRNSNGQIEKVQAQTVLVVEPGEWVPLAGASQQASQTSNSITTSTRSLSNQSASLQIRAVILD